MRWSRQVSLRPEGQEDGSHVKTAGGTFQAEGVHRLQREPDWSMRKTHLWWTAYQTGIKPEGPGNRGSEMEQETDPAVGPRKERGLDANKKWKPMQG